MKTIKYIILLVTAVSLLLTASCGDWLTIYPQNAQVSDEYWQSKSDVEAVVVSGYYYLREMTIPSLLPWGEVRSGAIFDIRANNLQSFQIKPTDKDFVNWGPLYKIINIANVVLANAHRAMEVDDTYRMEELNAHLCEAYFLRALCNFYLVRNWREAPLSTEPYEDDTYSYLKKKASEAELIAQIKSDITTALATGAAKEFYTTNWETKGRATKWAFYALMADVCLWSEDYETAYIYCNYLLEASSARKPVFMSTPTHNSFFSIFNPGNSNESVFEIQWNYEEEQRNTLPTLFDNVHVDRRYELSTQLLFDFTQEYIDTNTALREAVRTMYGGYFVTNPTQFEYETRGYVWKYCGGHTLSDKRMPTYYDPNFIIYRVADVMLMKAEALILRNKAGSEADKQEAVNIMNEIRLRSNLDPLTFTPDMEEEQLLTMLLYERRMELVGEGKSWYDILRFGRRDNNKYKETFLVLNVLKYNLTERETWLTSVLNDDNALFLPVWEEQLKVNPLLEQNPYYAF